MLGEVYSSVFRVMHLVCDVDMHIAANVSEELAASRCRHGVISPKAGMLISSDATDAIGPG